MAIQIEAMRDFLSGPAQLFDVLESSLPRIQKIRQNYDDAVIYESAADLPAPTGANVPLRNVGGRLGKVKKIPWLLKTLRHMSREADPAHYEAPQINLNPKDARWYNLSRVDSATVTTAGGTGVAFRKRDKQLTNELLSQTRQLLKDIDARFDELQETYRSARPQLTARESWKKVFDAQ